MTDTILREIKDQEGRINECIDKDVKPMSEIELLKLVRHLRHAYVNLKKRCDEQDTAINRNTANIELMD
jgi:hypothetical protein